MTQREIRERKARRQKILRRRRMIRNLRGSVIVILLISVVVASTRYSLYKNSPDYIISEEFLEQYNDVEDDSNTTDDSSSTFTTSTASTSAKRLDTLNSSVYNFEATATEVSIVANSEVTNVTSSNSEQQYEYEIEVIDTTTYYCSADKTLNVRSYPSTSGEILGSIDRGEELEVYGFTYFDSSSWAEISYNGTYAFVSANFLSEVQVSKYSQSDIYLFAQILYAEAGGCDSAEMARVGQVVLNRINTDYKEFTCCVDITSTLYHSGSYPDTVKKIENGLEPSQEALQVAEGLLNGTIQSNIGEDVYWQTGFVPSWEVEIVYVSEWGHYYSKLIE